MKALTRSCLAVASILLAGYQVGVNADSKSPQAAASKAWKGKIPSGAASIC